MNRRITFTLCVALALGLAGNAAAQTRDHLQCFKIKDPATKSTYTADLTTGSLVVPTLEPGCTIRLPARQYCIDVAKSNVEPEPPGAPEGAAGQTYLCYRAKCNKLQTQLDVADQFGERSVTISSTKLVCAPTGSPLSCDDGEENCSGTCVDLDTDAENCGACGTVCPVDATCSDGVCAPECAVDETDCGGTCVDLDTDAENCGMCGMICPVDATCSDGECAPECAVDETDCSGTCADLQSDEGNCGSCGNVCPIDKICSTGACTCLVGNDCSGTCVDFETDENNCGECGVVCPMGDTCITGVCVPPDPVACPRCLGPGTGDATERAS